MKSRLLILFGLSFGFVFSQSNCPTQARYTEAVFQNVDQTTGILFGNANPFNPFVSNQNLYLDFYEPQGDTAQLRPLILHAFGGGFLSGTRTSDDIPYWAQEYVKKGFVFASVDYRLGFNPLDGASIERAAYRCAQDIGAALRYLAENAALYRIDLNNIILTGNSAGSIGSLIVAYMKEADRPSSTYGSTLEPSDLGCFTCSGNNYYNNQRVDIKAFVNLWGAVLDTNFIDLQDDINDFIPCISFHGDADAVVPYQSGNPYSLPFFPLVYGSAAIHQRMDHEGLPNQLVTFPGFPHEPEQDYPWVSDTIVSKASKFLFPFIYGDSARISGDAKICVDSLVTLTGDYHAGSSYCWWTSGATIVLDSANIFTLSFDSNTLYQVILSETDYKGLTKHDTFNIQVQVPPISALSTSGSDGLILMELQNDSIIQAVWSFGNGATSQDLSPAYQFADTGMFEVQVTFSNEYCASDSSYLVESNKCPEAEFSYNLDDSTLYLYNVSSFASNVYWVDYEGSVYLGDTLVYPLGSEGNYPFILFAENTYCQDSVQESLGVLFCSSADFSYDATGLNVSFQDESFNAFFYNWNFGDGSISSLPNPVHTYASAGSYLVTLISTNINGCSDTLYIDIVLEEMNTGLGMLDEMLSVYPNPTNGVLYISGLDNSVPLQLKLYNSIGQVMFEGEALPAQQLLNGLSKGLYFLQISNELEHRTIAVVKE